MSRGIQVSRHKHIDIRPSKLAFVLHCAADDCANPIHDRRVIRSDSKIAVVTIPLFQSSAVVSNLGTAEWRRCWLCYLVQYSIHGNDLALTAGVHLF